MLSTLRCGTALPGTANGEIRRTAIDICSSQRQVSPADPTGKRKATRWGGLFLGVMAIYRKIDVE